MTVPPYQTYRNSGADYLGDVPAHWDVRPLKHLASFTSGGTPSKDRPEFWDGDIPWASAKDLKAEVLRDTVDHITDAAVDEGGAQTVPAGAVLVLVRGMMLARMFPVCVVGQPMAINQDLKALMPRPRVRGDYLAWLLRGTAPETLNRLDEAGHGTKALRMDAWTSLKLPTPPLAEQEAIASFLDRETAKIDALAKAQRQLIEMLKEKRQAVISHAVTRGIDHSVPAKDSGVEWLGKVPAQWLVTPIRKVARLESGHTPSRSRPEWWQDCTVPWFGLADVWQIREAKRDYVVETKEKVSELGLANSSARVLPANTVLLSRTASVGFSAIMGVPMATTQDFANWVCGERLNPEFLLQVLRGMAGEFRRLMMGSTHNTIYMPDIQSLTMALPPLDEQGRIVKHIKLLTGRYDDLTLEAEKAINLLDERRAALISAAVTGKIDVRGWSAADVRKAVAAEIVRLHARKPTFGRVKNQKLLYLAETHAGIGEIGGRYERQAAGPYDGDLITIVERDLEAAGVMTVSQPNGRGSAVSYSLNRAWKADRERLIAMLGHRLSAFEHVNAKLADLDTRGAEAVATLYAVWNDALIDDEACDDARVIRGFLDEWHREKREKFKETELQTWLGWMRRNGLVPSGCGPRTGTGGLFP